MCTITILRQESAALIRIVIYYFKITETFEVTYQYFFNVAQAPSDDKRLKVKNIL